jgi:hypothetical protein
MEHHAEAFFKEYCTVSDEQFVDYYTLFFAFDAYMRKHATAQYVGFRYRSRWLDRAWLLRNYITTVARGHCHLDKVVSGVSLKRWVT